MPSDPDFDELVGPLHDDNVSGASELSRTAADVLRGAAGRVRAASLEELRWKLGEVGRRILAAQPAMAPMVTLVREVLEAVEAVGASGESDAVEAGRKAAARAADDFRSSLEARAHAVVDAAAAILPTGGTVGTTGGTVGTISASGTVRRLLDAEAGPRGLRVVCFESRPMREGRALTEALADTGVEVLHAVDAAIDSLAPECDVVIFGTDAVGDAGVTNKIGAKALARAAHDAGVPVYVLADETKLLPPGHPQVVGDARPAAEVWDGAPDGVTVWNRYFEVVPMDLVTGIVTEGGVASPSEVAELRAGVDPPRVQPGPPPV